MRKMCRRFSGMCLAAIAIASFQANAMDTEEADTRPIKTARNSPISEVDVVDPRNGNLSINHTDLVLPGNGGLDIAVNRFYALNQASAGLSASLVRSYKWIALGPGWSMLAAPRIVDDNTYSANSSTSTLTYTGSSFDNLCAGNELASASYSYNGVIKRVAIDGREMAVLELPTGERQTLYSTGGGVAKTVDNWKVECSGGVITARSPNGVLYDFGALSANRMIGHFALSGMAPPVPPSRTVTYIDAIKATDTNGNWISYQYTTRGTPRTPWTLPSTYSPINSSPPGSNPDFDSGRVPSSITSSDGRSVTFSYDPTTGRLTSIADNAGRTIQYEYTNFGTIAYGGVSNFLARVVRPDASDWKYAYFTGAFEVASYAQTIGLTDANVSEFKLASLTYPTGGTVAYEYGYYNETVFLAPSNKPEYSRGERVTRRSLSTGQSWQYAYTKGSTGQLDVTTVTGPEGTTTYRYMGAGFSRTTDLSTAPYENNAWQVGQLVEKVLPDGSMEAYEWTPRQIVSTMRYLYDLGAVRDEQVWTADLLKRTYSRNGATYESTMSNFDAYGNPGTVVETGPNGGSRTSTITYFNDTTKWIIGKVKDETSSGQSTLRIFDANGNLLSLTRDGVATAFTYTTAGDVGTVTHPGSRTTTFSSYKRGIPQAEVQPEGVAITRIVSDAGFVTSETDGEGNVRSYGYDGLGRMTSTTYARGAPLAIAYTANTRTATRGDLSELTVYDGFGRATAVTLGEITTTYAYDYRNRKTFESNPGSSSGTSYQYDVLDRLTRITNADGSYQSITYGAGAKTVTDERGKVTTYSYRSYGDPEQQWLMNIAAPDSAANVSLTRNSRDLISTATQGGFTRTYGYDSNYYLTSVTNPETGVTTYGRDAAGNMTSRAVGSSSLATFAYDGQNRLTSATYASGTPSVTNTYNKINRLLSSSSSSAAKAFSYDDNGNLINETLTVNGLVFAIGYGYNNLDQLSTVSYPRSGNVISYAPDALGRPTQVSGYINSVSYWPSGQIQQIDYANGTTSAYDQNSRLWPSSFSTRLSSSYYLNSQYDYDGTGNLTSIADVTDSTYSRTLTYDDLARVVSTSGPWGAGNIVYSGAGNITSQILGSWGLVYSYDPNNRLSYLSGNRTSSFAYDTYGNVVSDGNNAYTYDEVPNLVCVNCSSTTNKIIYKYDGTNHRISATKGSVTSYEIFDSRGNQLIEFTPSQSNKLVEFIYLGGRRIAQRETP